MNTSLVTGFYEEPDVCIHKWNRHGDIAAVGENVFGMITELLDETEDVILKVNSIAARNIYPSTTVQPRRMISQFIDELVHFECGRDSLNKTSASNGTPRHADPILCHTKDIVP